MDSVLQDASSGWSYTSEISIQMLGTMWLFRKDTNGEQVLQPRWSDTLQEDR